MEVVDFRAGKTAFNVDLEKQFVPYWNGLLHLVARVEDRNLVRRYDWDRVIRDCEAFESNYVNTENFCESCPFLQIPSFVREKTRGVWDCKKVAQDNDVVYIYWAERKRKILIVIISLCTCVAVALCVVGGIYGYRYIQSKKLFTGIVNNAVSK